MYLARIAILATGATFQELSYFTSEDLPLGSIVRVPVRGREEYGLITGCEPAGDLKQALRRSPYPIKKLPSPGPARLLSRVFLRALFSAAQYEAAPWGALIAAYTPKAVLKARTSLPEAPPDDEREGGASYEPLIFTQARGERVAEYRRLAREALARGTSMLLLAPTIAEAERFFLELSRGIEGYVELFHGALTEKRQREAWARIVSERRAMLVIGTPVALSVPRTDLRLIVLDRAGSRTYMREERPHAASARVAEAVACALGARFIMAGTIPSVEAYVRHAQGEVGDYGISSTRLAGPAPIIIDLRAHKKEKGVWMPLAPETLERLREEARPKRHIVVLAARRGLAPMTACDDCGTVLACPACGRNLVLHANGSRLFRCHHCAMEVSASTRCGNCGGWRLTTLGIAIDRVAETIQTAVPTVPCVVISQDRGTPAQRLKAIAKWHEEGGILIGTEMLLPHLPDEVDAVFVASVDSLLSVPEYTAGERVFSLLCELRSRARGPFVVQTRDPGGRVMRALESGMYGAYLKEEAADRERFGYPPMRTLVRFTIETSPKETKALAAQLERALERHAPVRIDVPAQTKARARAHLIVRLAAGGWVDQRLLRLIRGLPRPVSVQVDPYSVHS